VIVHRTRRFGFGVCCLAAVLAVLAGSMPPAVAGEAARWAPAGPPTAQVGPFHTYPVDGDTCTIDLGLWAQEIEDSGINRFAFEIQLRGSYDPGNIGLPTYYKSGYWWSSPDFADDDRSQWTTFAVTRGWVDVPASNSPDVWVKIVGERDSFWQTDVVLMAEFGRPDCQIPVEFQM
jgi:hypothetical protein